MSLSDMTRRCHCEDMTRRCHYADTALTLGVDVTLLTLMLTLTLGVDVTLLTSTLTLILGVDVTLLTLGAAVFDHRPVRHADGHGRRR